MLVRTVAFGIRPEDIHDEEAYPSSYSEEHTLTATIRVYELLGAEVFLYFDIDDDKLHRSV